MQWHVGMARPANTPQGKGFASSLNYFHSMNNYYNSLRSEGCDDRPATDLWDTDRPAATLNGTGYEESLFAERAYSILQRHDPSEPLFLYYAFHTSCVGWPNDELQPDAGYLERFAFIADKDRRANHAMVALMDDVVGNITGLLRAKGMWDNTLVLWSSDNGGAVHLQGGANSYPLRGGYYNNWEGGIRVAAALGGGFLPRNRRGAVLEGFVHEADWYATFAHLAGIDPTDDAAAASQPPLPPIDSLNVWDLITGRNATSPRHEWALTPEGEDTTRAPHGGDAGYMLGGFKLLVGQVRQGGWCGQIHPNVSRPWDSFATIVDCGGRSSRIPGKVGCLFNVLDDPEERNDLAEVMPQKAQQLLGKLRAAQQGWFNPDRGEPQQAGCEVAQRTGFWQPFLP